MIAQPVATIADAAKGAASVPMIASATDPPIVYQTNLNASFEVSHSGTEKKPLECAGMASVEGGLIFLSDRHEHVLFTAPFDTDTMKLGKLQPKIVVPNAHGLLWDGEAITVRKRDDGSYVAYVLCSQSNDKDGRPLPQRRHMLRFTFRTLAELHARKAEESPAAHGVVLDVSPIREAVNRVFKKNKIEPYRTFAADFAGENKNTYRWGNVEGMALSPDNKTIICGMRNPLVKNKAVMFALRDPDPAFDQRDATLMRVTDVFLLNLGGRGVSDLAWDGVTKGYLITAARSNGPKLNDDEVFPPNSLDAAVFWWSGQKKEEPIMIAKAPDLKLEAVCRLGSSRFIALGTDEGDVSEGRDARESKLIIMEFTGIKGVKN